MLLQRHYAFLSRFKKTLAVVTTEISEQNPANLREMQSIRNLVDVWVVPSKQQQVLFSSWGIASEYQPFFVDEKLFYHRKLTRKELCAQLGIDFNLVKDKFLVGSFQRDSLGSDLSRPKWQKDPDLLVDILKQWNIPRDKWMVILVGPRRHYIINAFKNNSIPYYFHGREPQPGQDDISSAIVSENHISLLYNLIDCYLVTSRSEGGPKAVPEAALSQTSILSTPVGMAEDFLRPESIFYNRDEAVSKLTRLFSSNPYRTELSKDNYISAYRIGNYAATRSRWVDIYKRWGLL
jgi:hypothetical protein